MEQFRTEVFAPEFPFAIDHGTVISLMGSCFTEYIGEHLTNAKISTSVNPFGILFNPFSIMQGLERMLNDRPYEPDDLVQQGESWISLDHHGKFNRPHPNEALAAINAAQAEGAARLRESKVLFISLGSAWVYEHLATNRIVANCHKIPNQAFKKRILSVQDVHLILRHIPQFLKSKGLQTEVVFTVSPVRHWRDGAIQNQRSKAHLLAAVHAVVDEFDTCHYFPAYEMLMDDLRDYRFYAADMLHPSPQAIAYVWQRFQESFFRDETRIICNELGALKQAVEHRPVDPESNSFQRFLRKQMEIISVLERKYPSLDLSTERKHFQAYQL
jgi:hypothetical protein